MIPARRRRWRVAFPRTVLVASTIHQADDPRVRRRTVAVLAGSYPVRYATRPPGPAEPDDHEWVALDGGRARRWLAALREALRPDVALVSLHDPELLPLGVIVRLLRRIPVVLDVHEDVPAQLLTKAWVPPRLRRPLAAAAALGLWVAERVLVITLAEPGYARRFRRSHPVLPNYPLVSELPEPAADSGTIVYVGDITDLRGASLAVDAVAGMRQPHPLRLIGRCAPELRERLLRRAASRAVELDLAGFLTHPQAMRAVAAASVGLSPLADVPNYRHSLPTKVLEYLALGVPVVASDLPGTAEIARDRAGVILVSARDTAAWSAALDRITADASWRAAARQGVPAVRAEFAWPTSRLLAVYHALLTGQPAATATLKA